MTIDPKHMDAFLAVVGTDAVDRFNDLREFYDAWERNATGATGWLYQETSDSLFSMFIEMVAVHHIDRRVAATLLNRMISTMYKEHDQ